MPRLLAALLLALPGTIDSRRARPFSFAATFIRYSSIAIWTDCWQGCRTHELRGIGSLVGDDLRLVGMADVVPATVDTLVGDNQIAGLPTCPPRGSLSDSPIRVSRLAITAPKCRIKPLSVDRHPAVLFCSNSYAATARIRSSSPRRANG